MPMPDSELKPAAYKLPKRTISRLRRMAFWEDRRLSDIVLSAIDRYIDLYEDENGEYDPIPEGETIKLGRPPKKSVTRAS